MFVAKSYKNFERLSEPFEKNGKFYITIKMKSGLSKDVRAYTDKEYFKLYPEEKETYTGKLSKAKPWDKYYKSQKLILGFDKGYITLVKGVVEEEHIGWLQDKKCRFHNIFGWYLPSTYPIPEDNPDGISFATLYWEPIGDEEDWLIENKALIKEYIQKAC